MNPNTHQDCDKQPLLFTKHLENNLSHDQQDNLPLLNYNYNSSFLGLENKHIIEEHKVIPNIQDILQIKKRRAKIPKDNQPKAKKNKDIIEENPNLKKGHWSIEQSKRYHWFLEIYSQHFIDKQRRRMDKIFKTMANFIGTREAQQCRSHHQKMEKKYYSFFKIIGSLRKKFYHTLQAAPLLEELKENDHKTYSKVIQAVDIQNDARTDDDKNHYREISESDEKLDEQYYQGQKQCSRAPNLLEQDYQNNINMDFPWKC